MADVTWPTFGGDTELKWDLPSRPLGQNYGSMPSGGSGSPADGSGRSGRNINWGLLAGAGATGLAAAFAPSAQSTTPVTNRIQGEAANLQQTGAGLTQAGTADMASIMSYFRKLASGDPGAVLQATQPERSRVIDQFDAARKTIAMNTPKGGGQAGAINESRFKEAEALSNTTSTARREGAATMAGLAQHELDAGLATQSEATRQLATVLQPMLQQSQDDSASTWQTVGSIAAIAAMFI